MEEIDTIVIHSLKEIGCSLEDDIKTLSQFSPAMLVDAVSKCLLLIEPELQDIPKSLPPGMAQRYAVTQKLAEAIKSVGFRGDVGYQTLLYSNTIEVRRVLMYLVEKLPKETDKSVHYTTDETDIVGLKKREIATSYAMHLRTPWVPDFCKRSASYNKLESGYTSRTFATKNLEVPYVRVTQKEITQEIKDYWKKHSPSVFQQTDKDSLLPSILHDNDRSLYAVPDKPAYLTGSYDSLKVLDVSLSKSSSLDGMSEKSQKLDTNLVKNSAEQEESKEELEIKKLTAEIDALREAFESQAIELHEITGVIDEYAEELQNEEERVQEIEAEKKTEDRIEILLEDPENSIEKLEERLISASQKMDNLKAQWEEARQPIDEELKLAQQRYDEKDKKVINEVKKTRELHESLVEDLRYKMQLQSKLVQELEKLDPTISRSGYTKRILDIIDNIKKQNIDIDNVLRDTRKLQKEINVINGQLDRQFAATDDLIFKSAKRDDYAKRAYKLLATLHADCTELVALVEETGAVIREVRELEDQIEIERAKNVADNLRKITADLEEIEKSNQ